jgi:hypothetical protein
MAFEPVNKDSAANFRATGTPGEPDFFTPRLTLRQEESQSVKLTDLPGVLAVPGVNIPGLAAAIMPAPLPPDFKTDPPKIACIEQGFIGRNLFKVTGRAPGVAHIHAEGRAFLINAPFVAELIVTVVDKPSGGTAGSRDLIAIKDFEDGLVLGLAQTAVKNARIVIEKTVREPENFGLGFVIGYHKGLLDGLKALVKSLGEDVVIEMIKKPPEAQKAAVALVALIAEVEANRDEIFGANAKASGKKVGEAIAAALTDEIANKPTREIGKWVGAIVGAVAFEVIIIIVTEGIGEAVKVARAPAEIEQLVARLRPMLENLLGGLVKLKSSFRAGMGMRAAEEGGATGAGMADAVPGTLGGAADAARALPAIEGATEVRVTLDEYKAALSQVFPGEALDPVARLVDGVGSRAAQRAVNNPQFMQAIQQDNMALAGTLYHSAAAQEIRALPATAAPPGWKIEAELTLQSGQGGGRADVFLEGPANELVEFDWKTTGQSGLRSIKQMQKHAGQVRALKNGANLTTQQSRSWMDYVRPLLP